MVSIYFNFIMITFVSVVVSIHFKLDFGFLGFKMWQLVYFIPNCGLRLFGSWLHFKKILMFPIGCICKLTWFFFWTILDIRNMLYLSFAKLYWFSCVICTRMKCFHIWFSGYNKNQMLGITLFLCTMMEVHDFGLMNFGHL